MPELLVGPVSVRSPASSANLGPGFDSLGLALGLFDEYTAEFTGIAEVRVNTWGEGQDDLPRDRRHLVARAVLAGLAAAGITDAPGLAINCKNRIPHARGLGSSSAAIVGGLVLARELAGAQDVLTDERIVAEASSLEGHPDNVAAAALGGFTTAWTEGGQGRAISRPVHPDVRVVVFIPETRAATDEARALLPQHVPMAAAVANIARSALLVTALTAAPDHLLLAATADQLHQQPRRAAYPASLALVERLRSAGVAAAISGAGPTVIALLGSEPAAARLAATGVAGFTALALPVVSGAEVVHPR